MRIRFPNLFTVLAFFLAGSSPAHAVLADRIAAVVNDDIILYSEVLAAAQSWKNMLDAIPDADRREKKRREVHGKILDQMIDDRLMEQQIKEFDIKVTSKEVDKGIERIMQQNGIPDLETMKHTLKMKGIDWEEYRKEIKKQFQRMQFVQAKVGNRVRVTKEDIREAYEKEQAGQNREYEYRASHIIFRVKKDAPEEEVMHQREKAMEILGKVRAGEDFAALARTYSEGPTARNGGDLGYFQKGIMVQVFEDACVKLKVGETTDLVRTPFGFHIIKLTDKRPLAGEDFETAKGRLQGRLADEQREREMGVWMKALREKAYVRILLNDPPAPVLPSPVETGEKKMEKTEDSIAAGAE